MSTAVTGGRNEKRDTLRIEIPEIQPIFAYVEDTVQLFMALIWILFTIGMNVHPLIIFITDDD